MMITVALNADGEISYSLEKTTKFKMYETSDNMITDNHEVEVAHLDLKGKADYLKSQRVEVLFIETLDDRETAAFGPYALQVYVNANGAPDELVTAYLDGAYEEVLEEARAKEKEDCSCNHQNIRDTELAYEAGMIEPECGCEDKCECQDESKCGSEKNCGCSESKEENTTDNN